MCCKKNTIKQLVTVTLLSIVSFQVYADSLSGTGASVVDALPEGLQLSASTTLTKDSNIFKLPDSTVLAGYPGKSDTIKSIQADLNYNKTFGMQNFTLDATIAHNQFNKFTSLDNDSNSYKALWAWQVDKYLSGTMGANQNQALANYASIQNQIKTMTTTQSRYINGDWMITGPWHAVFGVSQNQTSYSALVSQIQGRKGNSTNAGFSYVSEAQNTISIKRQNTQGSYTDRAIDYTNLVDNGYTETDDLLNFKWTLSGKSLLTGELKHLSLKQTHFSQRDYSGMAGNINYLWSVSGKTTVKFTAQRNFGQFLTAYSSYSVTDDFAISPSWQLTEKVSLHATFDRASVNYLGAINGGAASTRVDTTQTAMLGADWAPTRTITLNTSLQHTKRDSSNLSYLYGDNMMSVSAQISF